MNKCLLLLVILEVASAFFQEDIEIFPPRRLGDVLVWQSLQSSSGRIINGKEVVPHSIPYQVFLLLTARVGLSSCGGSLITRNYVLTAAHCLENIEEILVVLGAHDISYYSGSIVLRRAVKWLKHSDYNEYSGDNDIGLIKLARSVKLSNKVGLAQLPSRSHVGKNLQGLYGRVSGWGQTNFGYTSDVLLSTSCTVISNKKCEEYFLNMTNRQICLLGCESSACYGDSGGPMVINGVQMGIVAYGADGCPPDIPHVYTRVDQFLNWIERNSNWKASENSSNERVVTT